MNVKKVGEFIKQKRKEKKLTQKELAKIHSISFDEVQKDCKEYYDLNSVNWNLYIYWYQYTLAIKL